MPSLQYMNQSAPFWDFLANLEQEGMNHSFFDQWAPPHNDRSNTEGGNEGRRGPPPFGPFGWGFPFGGGRGFPHHGPPPPPGFASPPHHEEHDEDGDFEKDFEKELNKEFEDDNEKQSKEKEKEDKDNGEGPSGSGSETEGCCRRRSDRHRGTCGSRRGRHGCGPRGPPHGPPHGPPPPHHHHHRHHGHHGPGRRGGGWGGWGRWNRGGPFGGTNANNNNNNNNNPLSFLSTLFDAAAPNPEHASEDFSPEADIFDTPSSFVVHVSLPGAKKEDVGVNWDVEKSELSIAGVIYRPGDEKFLEQLAMSERKVGAFERKVRLGTRANPANVDVDGISAKLEDGVLRVEVPKMGEGGFVEVKRVDIE